MAMPVPVRGESALEPGPEPATGGFWGRFEALRDRHVRLWREAGDGEPRLGPRVGAWRRYQNARATRRLIGEIAERVEAHPDRPRDAVGWRCRLRERLQRFGEERFGWPEGYRQLALGDEFYGATVDFVRQARTFDAAIRMADVGQAMRNVWIVNSLQMIFGCPVELTPPVFAYSMLYPYTDNLLDDPALTTAVKDGMNQRLGRWLSGDRAEPRGARERRIRELVSRIEAHYPPHRRGDVFLSLQAIHRGQIHSLRLQRGRRPPGRDAILAIQVEKGGASVLADGYLALGRLDPDQEDFCFGYGVLLQLLDDLQDARADRAAGHATLFAVDAGGRPLDRLVGRLWSYMSRVLDETRCLSSPGLAAAKDLIRRNCTFLLMSAIADSPDLFSRGFRRSLERRWPLSFRAMRSLRRRARSRFERTRRVLEHRQGVESLWDLVLSDHPSHPRSLSHTRGERGTPPAGTRSAETRR